MRKRELGGTGFRGSGMPVWVLTKGVSAISIYGVRGMIAKEEVVSDK